MALTLGDLISNTRNLISEPSTVRFSQAMLAQYASNAQRQLTMDLDHPEGTYTFNITGGQREFQLPEIVKILRVYMLGPDGSMQPLVGTDIPTLQGDIQETFDNTSGQVIGSPVQSPQVFTQQQQAYPVTNVPIGGRVPTKNSWGPNSRPSYYMRGGYIGFSIPPMSTSPQTQVRMDYIPSPPDLVTPSQQTIFPALCKMALVWKMVEYCHYSDNDSRANDAAQKYQLELGKLQNWIFALQATRPKGIVPVTKRMMIRGRRYH